MVHHQSHRDCVMQYLHAESIHLNLSLRSKITLLDATAAKHQHRQWLQVLTDSSRLAVNHDIHPMKHLSLAFRN